MPDLKLRLIIDNEDYGAYNLSALSSLVSDFLQRKYGLKFEQGYPSALLTLSALLFCLQPKRTVDSNEVLESVLSVLFNDTEDEVINAIREIWLEETVKGYNEALWKSSLNLPKLILNNGKLRLEGSAENLILLFKDIVSFIKEELKEINEQSKYDFEAAFYLATLRHNTPEERTTAVKISCSIKEFDKE